MQPPNILIALLNCTSPIDNGKDFVEAKVNTLSFGSVTSSLAERHLDILQNRLLSPLFQCLVNLVKLSYHTKRR